MYIVYSRRTYSPWDQPEKEMKFAVRYITPKYVRVENQPWKTFRRDDSHYAKSQDIYISNKVIKVSLCYILFEIKWYYNSFKNWKMHNIIL